MPDNASSESGGWGWRILGPPLIVTLLGVLLTAMAVHGRQVALNEQATKQVWRVSTADAGALQTDLQRLYGAMATVAGFFDAVGTPTEQQFRSLAEGILADHPELQALQYSAYLTHDERPDVEAGLRERGVAQSIVEPGPDGVQVAADRPEYVVVLLNEPAAGNREVFGFDIIFRQANRATVEAARDSGEAQVGGRTVLVQGNGEVEAVHLYAPIYAAGLDVEAATVEQRRAAFVGIVGAVVRYPELMVGLGAASDPEVDEVLLDLTSAAEPLPLWRSPGSVGVSASELMQWPVQVAVPAEGRELIVVGRPAAAKAPFPAPWLVGAVGLLFTGLLVLLVWTWMDHRRQARLTRELHQASSRLKYLADRDVLTGLPHRDRLREWSAERLAADPATGMAVMFVDLDSFRDINSTMGHPTGDLVLAEVGTRLGQAAGAGSLVSRVGGDEFVVVLCGDAGATSPAAVSDLGHRLLQAVADRPVVVGGRELLVTASIGVALRPRDGESLEELLTHADAAVREAKRGPNGSLCGFTPAMAQTLALRQRLSEDLQRLAGDPGRQLHLAYQAQVDMRSGAVVGAEALLRWDHPAFGSVSPGEFIPIAEQTGTIRPIGEWVVAEAVRQVVAWQGQGLWLPRVSVNVAPQQLADDSLPLFISATLRGTGLAAERVEVEVTESTAMTAGGREQLEAMAAMGLAIAIDDFGSGFSSLSRLGDMPADRLKIDRTFVARIGVSATVMEVIRAIVALAQALDLEVVAEGVETEAQRSALLAEGVVVAQGFGYARPLPPVEFEQLLARGLVVLSA